MSKYESGVRSIIDNHLIEIAKERRDYGSYWSASSAGYCMRKNIFDRLQIPFTKDDPRKQRIFTSGHIFHKWIQELTMDAGVSVAQEVELIDDDIHVKGHFDDLILIEDKLILYDYKTQNSRAFGYKQPMSHFHRLQLGTYMYILRNLDITYALKKEPFPKTRDLVEARILKISKDDLRLSEEELFWSDQLASDVKGYWDSLNAAWELFKSNKLLPACTCADHSGGFMAKEKFNPYFYQGSPCSIDWLKIKLKEREDEKRNVAA